MLQNVFEKQDELFRRQLRPTPAAVLCCGLGSVRGGLALWGCVVVSVLLMRSYGVILSGFEWW